MTAASTAAFVTTPTPRQPTPSTLLTDREVQVLNGISYGHSNPEIGRILFLSEDTIKTYCRRIFRKLGVRDRAHAVRVGLEQGFLAPNEPMRAPVPHTPPAPAVTVLPVPGNWFQPVGPGDPQHIVACYAAQSCFCRRKTNGEVSA